MKKYCERCKGGTKKVFPEGTEFPRMYWEEIRCPECDGKGYIEV